MAISPISEIIEDLKQGRMVVLMDDEDRENEGDLVMVAEHVTPEDINFMAKYGRGLICLTLDRDRCEQLQLPLQVRDTHYQQTTNFTLSIEAATGVTTGISAADRAKTVQAAVAVEARASDIVMPGHVFPIMAQKGGVLNRAGHTEAGVDLARLADANVPACVICEIMNEDGTMARLPELVEFSKQHNLKIGTIADLIHYRMENESTIKQTAEAVIDTDFGQFKAITYHDDVTDTGAMALVKGDISAEQPTLVRVHVQESLLDLFTGIHRPEGSWSLHAAMQYIAREGHGVVVILQHHESMEQLSKRVRLLQQGSEEKNTPADQHQIVLRTYGLGSQILTDLGIRKMRVMGYPIKTPGMSGFGLETTEYLDAGAGLDKTSGKVTKIK
ncbi:MAG: bifunctional 3,4-dihydroxy-2-butanone-4-phosphate synthase/GTP cyclohydrolase II [Gammaproteobacteria bacterium]|nr:bifunctional 3,4-dihydroxy-2-butanone-4-phosphate synthase/GTP cyclohydrolase II [Gammaproteobacteria bacterium]